MVTESKSKDQDPPDKVNDPGFFSMENIRSLGLLAVILLAIRWSICSPYHVPTASMEPSIKVGDRLLAWKLSYDLRIPFTDIVIARLGSIRRGDIVVFRYPLDTSLDYVKRVIGLPGDKLQMVDDVLYINGVPQPRIEANQREVLEDIKDHKEIKKLFRETLDGKEHWTINNIARLRFPGTKKFPTQGYVVVPKDSVFVIGDNRDNSQDSRSWGKVPLSYVRGKALFVIWSMYSEDDSWWPKFRLGRFFSWLQ